jgi:hypothetical protein
MKWKNYFFTVDFSNASDFLKNKPAGFVFDGEVAETLAIIFQEHDPRRSNSDAWQAYTGDCDFNTVGAEVTYNDKNSRDFRTNAKYSHVMVLNFNEGEYCPHGKFYLQYNLPEELIDGDY